MTRNTPRPSTRHLCKVFDCSPRSRALPTGHRREHHPPGQSALGLLRYGPRKEEPTFTDGRFDSHTSCLLEGLRVQEGGEIGTLSAPEANN